MANKIFLSYRRYDTAGTTGRLHDYLEDVFGKGNVFKDVSDIPAGVDFRKVIGKEILDSKIVLVMIGKHYTSVKGEDDQPRLHDPNDFVHIEVATAVNMKKIVIPVLVDGATMPRADELPESLKDLVNFNAVILSHDRWKSDVNVLVEKLKYHLEPSKEEKKVVPPKPQPRPQPQPPAPKPVKQKSWMLPATLGVLATLIILIVIGLMMPDEEATTPTNQGKDLATNYVYVNTDELNIRNEPGTEGTEVVGVVNDGDELKVVGQDWVGNTKWFNVESSRHRGWVSGNLVTEEQHNKITKKESKSLPSKADPEPLDSYENYEEEAVPKTYQELILGSWRCYTVNDQPLVNAGFNGSYFDVQFFNNGVVYHGYYGVNYYYSLYGNNLTVTGLSDYPIVLLDQNNLYLKGYDLWGVNVVVYQFKRI